MNLQEGLSYIDKLEDLGAMPSIALDLMGMLNDPSSSLRSIVERIQLDQAMISYILKHCNSPLYGVRNEVTSITMAINLLGYSNLKSILMSYFIKNLYQLSGKNEIKNYLWKHSISVAVFSRLLGEHSHNNPEEAYLSGLLHDVGKMVLYLDQPAKYESVIQEVEQKKRDFIEVEKELFQFTHADAGYFLMEKWRFSAMLKEVALYHHDVEQYRGNNKNVAMIDFANQICHHYLENREAKLDHYKSQHHLTDPQLENLARVGLKTIETLSAIV